MIGASCRRARVTARRNRQRSAKWSFFSAARTDRRGPRIACARECAPILERYDGARRARSRGGRAAGLVVRSFSAAMTLRGNIHFRRATRACRRHKTALRESGRRSRRWTRRALAAWGLLYQRGRMRTARDYLRNADEARENGRSASRSRIDDARAHASDLRRGESGLAAARRSSPTRADGAALGTPDLDMSR